MTKEYALWLLKQLMIGASVDAKPIIPQYELAQALDLAIKALEQQSTDAKTYLKRRDENYVEYNVEWFLKNWELELEILSDGKIKPTDADCISREAVIDYITANYGFCHNLIECVRALSPVTSERPKGKWIWDLRMGLHKCSVCGKFCDFDYLYCPNCGSYNGGGEDG